MAGPIGSETIVIQRAPWITNPRDGTRRRDWANPVNTTVEGCSVQPFLLAEKLNFEVNAEREYARTGMRVWAPAGSLEPESSDRIQWRGRTYEVFGHASPWYDLEGQEDHVAFVMQLREG